MNTKVSSVLLTIALLFTISSSLAAVTEGAGAHGGDPVAQEFATMGQKAVDYVTFLKNPYHLNLQALQNEIASVTLTSTNSILYDDQGIERFALNIPSKNLIEINRNGWASIGANTNGKMALALHEYLGIAGVEVDNYSITSQIFQVISGHIDCSLEVYDQSNKLLGSQSGNDIFDINHFATVSLTALNGRFKSESTGIVTPKTQLPIIDTKVQDLTTKNSTEADGFQESFGQFNISDGTAVMFGCSATIN
jgi:hypothetical protein